MNTDTGQFFFFFGDKCRANQSQHIFDLKYFIRCERYLMVIDEKYLMIICIYAKNGTR